MPDVSGDNLGRQKFKRFLVGILPVFIAVVQSAEGYFSYDMDPKFHKKCAFSQHVEMAKKWRT
jgi:uncharacterized protein YpmB